MFLHGNIYLRISLKSFHCKKELEDIEFVLYYDGNWELSYLYKMLYLNFVFMLNIQPLSRSKKKKRLDCGQNQIERLAKGDVLHKQSTSKKFETRN